MNETKISPSGMEFSTDRLQMGKSLLITILSRDPGCLHKLTYRFGSLSGTLAVNVKDRFQWLVPDMSNACGLSGTCTISCTTSLGGKVLGTVDKTLTLTVPDPSRAVLSVGTLGLTSQVECPRKSPYFSLEVSLILGQEEYPIGKGMEDSFSWTPPYELAGAFPDQIYMDGKLCCRTWNKENLVGVKYSLVNLKVPMNEKTRPLITGVTLTPVSGKIPESFGFLMGKTGVKAEIEAKSLYSFVKDYEISVGTASASGNPAEIKVLNEAGVLQVRATVRDLRGFTGDYLTELNVTPYEKPRILPLSGGSVVCGRANAGGSLSPEGTSLKIQARVEPCRIAPQGENLNQVSFGYRITEPGAAAPPFTMRNPDAEGKIDLLLENLVPETKVSYEAQLMAEDSLGEQTILSFPILTALVSFGLYDGVDGAAFGKYPELPHVVDLAPQMTLLVRGKLELPGEVFQDLSLAEGVPAAGTMTGSFRGAGFRLRPGKEGVLAFSCGKPPEGGVINRSPVPYPPKAEVSAVCASQGGAALVTLGTDGFLRLSLLLGSQEPQWIQGLVTYFI